MIKIKLSKIYYNIDKNNDGINEIYSKYYRLGESIDVLFAVNRICVAEKLNLIMS